MQDILSISLAVLSVVLLVLLLRRRREESSKPDNLQALSLDQFSDFLKKNSVSGSVVDVAHKMSDLLKDVFGCEYIIFLRKKRNQLELNYYHGINKFNWNELRMPFNEDLRATLNADFLPRPISALRSYINKPLGEKLDEFEMDLFFPIFWRDNLYGVYFIKSNLSTASPLFKVLIGAVAQSLSAAYHIKWHESKIDTMEKQVKGYTKIIGNSEEQGQEIKRILKLVKHRKTDTIIPRLIQQLRETTALETLVYIYEPTEPKQPLMMYREHLEGSITIPPLEIFENILSGLQRRPLVPIDTIKAVSESSRKWLQAVKNKNLTYLASFPVNETRRGIMLLSSPHNVEQTAQSISMYREYSTELVDNAATFERFEALSYTDSLTNLANQRYFFKRFNEEISRAERYDRSLALIIIDVDELKQINDTHGHLAGDSLISQMGKILRKSIRAIDVVARYGGDEFCIIMPEASAEMCRQFSRRLIRTIGQTSFKLDKVSQPLNASVSVGAALFPPNGKTAKELLFAADMALLQAKENGRNQSVLAPLKTAGNQS